MFSFIQKMIDKFNQYAQEVTIEQAIEKIEESRKKIKEDRPDLGEHIDIYFDGEIAKLKKH